MAKATKKERKEIAMRLILEAQQTLRDTLTNPKDKKEIMHAVIKLTSAYELLK